MKFKQILININLLVFSLYTINLSAQVDTNNIGKHFKIAIETPIYECDLLGTLLSTDSSYKEAPLNAVFTYIGTKGNDIIIRFWLWEKEVDKQQKFNFQDEKMEQKTYFLMSKAAFKQNTMPRYSQQPQFTIGTAAVPFKIRTNPFIFTNDVTLGSVIGAKFRMSSDKPNNYYNLLFGFGLSSVQLDSSSTGGSITKNALVSNPASLTASFGGVLEFSNIQIGVFVGADFINNNEVIKWTHQGKPWVSIGLGYALYSNTPSNQLTKARKN